MSNNSFTQNVNVFIPKKTIRSILFVDRDSMFALAVSGYTDRRIEAHDVLDNSLAGKFSIFGRFYSRTVYSQVIKQIVYANNKLCHLQLQA